MDVFACELSHGKGWNFNKKFQLHLQIDQHFFEVVGPYGIK
jgi:hypothetical protein